MLEFTYSIHCRYKIIDLPKNGLRISGTMLTVNEYFEGKVKSIGFQAPESKATVGVIQAGEYEFGTSQIEIMSVLTGTLFVRLPGQENFLPYIGGQSFTVELGKKFQVKCDSDVSYLCRYF